MTVAVTKALSNIAQVKIVTDEGTPRTFTWDTASKASLKPSISDGSDEVLRVKNKLVARNKFEDLVIGYEVELEDNTLAPEVFAIIDGGVITYDAVETEVVEKYTAPAAGSAVSRIPFDLYIYTEEKDTDGETLGFAQLKYPSCKGKPVEMELEDGKFVVPKLPILSMPSQGAAPFEIEFMDAIPV